MSEEKITKEEEAEEEIINNCIHCGRRLKKIIEFLKREGEEKYKEFQEEIKKQTGEEPKDPTGWNCPNCGQIYDENFVDTGNKIAWLQELRKYYGYN